MKNIQTPAELQEMADINQWENEELINMQTMEQWNKSEKDFSEWAKVGSQIDEEIYDYFLGILPPIYHSKGVFQVSEAYSHTKGGFATYGTFQEKDSKFYYHGNLTKEQAGRIE